MIRSKFNIVILFFLLLFLGCSSEYRIEKFSEKLTNVDNLIENNTRKSALKALKKIRKNAVKPEHFLSIAKREKKLYSTEQALHTLKYGLKKQSVPEIAAYITYLLINEKKYDEAVKYAPLLKNTSFASLAAEAIFKSSEKTKILHSPFLMEYDYCMAAFYATGEQVFLINAALGLAKQGQMQDALSLRKDIKGQGSSYPYFWALLAFDLGEFSIVFEELNTSLIMSDIFDTPEKELSAKARKHLLLAADASFGLGDFEMADANWQLYTDRFPENTPIVLYNLALMAPTGRIRNEKLQECITRFPTFYPAIALYTRDYINFINAIKVDGVTEYLAKKDFYSIQMEKDYFSNPQFATNPKEILNKAINTPNADPRFALELFRYLSYTNDAVERRIADIWTLLEKYPNEPEIKNYAKWYFAKNGDLQKCFSVDSIGNALQDSFYTGLKASIIGDTKLAIDSYIQAQKENKMNCAATVNYACTESLLGNNDLAIDIYTKALDLTQNDLEKSNIHFRIAEILVKQNLYERAQSVLGYAVQLNKNNYDAQSLLNKIKAIK